MCLIPKTPPSIPSFIIFVFAQGSCSHPFFWRYGSISSYYLQPSIRRMGCLPIIKEHLQTCILSRFSVFQESDCNKKISEFPTTISPWLQVCIYWNAVCYLMAWIFIIIFTMIFTETQSFVYNDIHWNTVFCLQWYSLKYSLLLNSISCRHPFLLWYFLKYSLLFDDISCRHPYLLWYFHYFTGAVEVIQSVIGTVFILQDSFCSHSPN